MTQLDESRVPLHWLERGADLTWPTKPWSWSPHSSVIKISGISQGFGTLMDHGFHLYMRRISVRPLVLLQANLFGCCVKWDDFTVTFFLCSFLRFSLGNILWSILSVPTWRGQVKTRIHSTHLSGNTLNHWANKLFFNRCSCTHSQTHVHTLTHTLCNTLTHTNTHAQSGTAFSYLFLVCVLFLLPFIQWITRIYSLTHLQTHRRTNL